MKYTSVERETETILRRGIGRATTAELWWLLTEGDVDDPTWRRASSLLQLRLLADINRSLNARNGIP